MKRKVPKPPTTKLEPLPAGLTEEDAELWGFVVQSVTRLEVRRKKRASPATEHSDDTAEKASHRTNASERSARSVPRESRESKARMQAPSAPDFDRREARHIARGRIDIEARIDLHGLRQAEAHRRLIAFIHRAYASGHKHVLVITGKGRENEDHHALPFYEALDRAPRGILRRSVPLWLEEAELRGVVLSYKEAAAHHGGSGALYVRLRSSSRTR